MYTVFWLRLIGAAHRWTLPADLRWLRLGCPLAWHFENRRPQRVAKNRDSPDPRRPAATTALLAAPPAPPRRRRRATASGPRGLITPLEKRAVAQSGLPGSGPATCPATSYGYRSARLECAVNPAAVAARRVADEAEQLAGRRARRRLRWPVRDPAGGSDEAQVEPTRNSHRLSASAAARQRCPRGRCAVRFELRK